MQSRAPRVADLVPRLPYICEDRGCGCRIPSPYPQDRVRFGESYGCFQADVFDGENGMLLETFREHNLTDLVDAVHRNYPHARKVR